MFASALLYANDRVTFVTVSLVCLSASNDNFGGDAYFLTYH